MVVTWGWEESRPYLVKVVEILLDFQPGEPLNRFISNHTLEVKLKFQASIPTSNWER